MKTFLRIIFLSLFVFILIENASAMLITNSQRQDQLVSTVDFMFNNIDKLDPEICFRGLDGHFRSDLFKEFLNQSILRWPNASWWNVSDVSVVGGLRWPYYSVSLSGSGYFFASASVDGAVKIFEKTQEGNWNCEFALIKDARAVALSPEGRVFVLGTVGGVIEIYQKNATGYFDRIESFDRNSGGHSGIVNSIAVSSDGRVVLSCASDNSVKVFKRTYKKNCQSKWILAEDIKSQCFGDDGISSGALSSNGKCLAYSTWGGDIVIYRRLARGKWKPARCFDGEGYGCAVPVNSIALNAEGSFLVAGLDDARIRIYQMGKRDEWVLKNIFCNNNGSYNVAINSVAVSADGSVIVSGADDGSVKFYRKNTQNVWTLVKVFDGSNGGYKSPVYTVSLSDDGCVAASGAGDGTAKIYSLHKFKNLESLFGFVKQIAK